MKYRYPDFYYDFQCSAGACQHTCCKDWDIELDEETVELYRNLPKPEAEDILRRLKFSEEGASMCLTEDERCPFLQKDGLCELILRYGEDYISDICTDHPRFYNSFHDTFEMGLGLACEEVVKLLLDSDEPLTFIEEDDGETESEIDEQEQLVLNFREECESYLEMRDSDHYSESALLISSYEPDYILPETKEIMELYLNLDVMDPEWNTMVEKAIACESVTNERLGEILNNVRYERLFQYLMFRHVPSAHNVSEAVEILKFVISACILIASLEISGVEVHEAVRMFSSEIEYSDCNITMLRNML